MADAGPTAAWQLADAAISPEGMEPGVDVDSGAAINNNANRASRIRIGGRRQFTGAILVVEGRDAGRNPHVPLRTLH